jgi:glycosyltransferase involved in cell wall biosynthesis
LKNHLLYFSPSAAGGLADYAHEQANALAGAEVTVEMLTTAQYAPRANCRYQVRPVLTGISNRHQSGLARKISWMDCLFKNFRTLNREIKNGDFKTVLMGSYSEYLAPFWAGQFRALARTKVKFGAVVHDPVRDFVVGPRWWHRHSIAEAYSFLSEAFVHEDIQLDTVRPVPALRTTVIPHGPFRFPEPTDSHGKVREKMSIPDKAFVMLSFGHIRDGKNLDLVIRTLSDLPDIYLVVAGKEQSSAQKPICYYQNLARTLGVQERCRWVHGHVPENEIGNLFIGADLILLTYSENFRSASGVLNTAVRYRKPCLASSGVGNLRSMVEGYALGWFVEPDDISALKTGIETAMRQRIDPRWDVYEAENSWERNAQLVKEKMFQE